MPSLLLVILPEVGPLLLPTAGGPASIVMIRELSSVKDWVDEKLIVLLLKSTLPAPVSCDVAPKEKVPLLKMRVPPVPILNAPLPVPPFANASVPV